MTPSYQPSTPTTAAKARPSKRGSPNAVAQAWSPKPSVVAQAWVSKRRRLGVAPQAWVSKRRRLDVVAQAWVSERRRLGVAPQAWVSERRRLDVVAQAWPLLPTLLARPAHTAPAQPHYTHYPSPRRHCNPPLGWMVSISRIARNLAIPLYALSLATPPLQPSPVQCDIRMQSRPLLRCATRAQSVAPLLCGIHTQSRPPSSRVAGSRR
ncbi:MAG: hypothetical protein K8963_03970 [Proteobacteria bacterium]|nr:hypothetical protein [Pseudomonadota bacterium]